MQPHAYLELIIAFLIGSIPFGWIIAKLWGVSDLRKVGSTNTGATNVVRTAGVVPGALTFLLDFAKSIGPVLYFPEYSIWIGLAAVLGHCYSPFLKFKGGKGVSTTLGALCAFNIWIGGAGILVYGLALAFTRTSAMGSLFAMLALLAGTCMFVPGGEAKIVVTIMIAVVLRRHEDNWNKLLVVTMAFLLSTSVLAAAAPTVMQDFRGKSFSTQNKPKRIAALIPSLAETLVDLGMADRLVGAPEYSRLPKTTHLIKSFGPYNRISAESVYETHPDLVLASMDGNDSSMVHQLEELGLNVITVNTQSLPDIIRSMEVVSAAVGDPQNKKVSEMHRVLESHHQVPASKRRVFVQIGWEPIVTISKDTFISELVQLAGGINIFETTSTKYPRPNPEEVIAKDPEVIVLCKLTDDDNEVQRATSFWRQFKQMSAVKAGKIYVIPGDWLTKPNLSLVRGIAELRRIL